MVFIIFLFLTPCYFCTAHRPCVKQLSDLVLPLLRLQLRFIHSPTGRTTQGHVPKLILVNLGSPVYSLGIAIAAWVAAAFWAYAAILGNPDGLDQHHDDGREAVMKVRAWWQMWLERATV